MAAANVSRGDEQSARIEALEAELERKEQELATVIERYERVLDTRARLRRETREDEAFVWTGQQAGEDSRNDERRTSTLLREFFQR